MNEGHFILIKTLELIICKLETSLRRPYYVLQIFMWNVSQFPHIPKYQGHNPHPHRIINLCLHVSL
jgi:hypothetical protein